MASFSSILSAAKASAKAPARETALSFKSSQQFGQAKITSNIQAASRRASEAAIGGVLGAATQIISGDTAGGLRTLGNLPGAVLDRAFPAKKRLGALNGNPYGPRVAGNPHYGLSARRDAVLNFNWYALLPQISNYELPWYYCEAASLSYRTIDTQQIIRRGHPVPVPAGYSVPPLRLTFMLDESSVVMNYLGDWQDAILGRYDGSPKTQGAWGRPADFMKNITVNVLSVNKDVVMSVVYRRAWPTNLDTMNLVSDSSGRLLAEVEFAVEDVTYEFKPARFVTASMSGAPTSGFVTGSVQSVLGAIGNRVSNAFGLSTSSSLLGRAASTVLGF